MFLFFNLSGGEIILIMFFILIFFGSKNIPDIARTLGKGIRQFKDATQEIQRDIENSAREVRHRVENEARQITSEINAEPEQLTPPNEQPEVPRFEAPEGAVAQNQPGVSDPEQPEDNIKPTPSI